MIDWEDQIEWDKDEEDHQFITLTPHLLKFPEN